MTPAVPSNTASDVVLSGTDLTRGVNVFISDNIGCDTIYLDTKQDVSLSYNEGSGIVFRQVRDEQGYTCLIPDVREANKSAVDEVMITTPDNQSKSVTVVLRYNNPSGTRASALENRGLEALARGIPTCSLDGVSDLYMFNKELLAADTLVVSNTLGTHTDVKEYHETSVEKLTNKFSVDFGFSGSIPIKAVVVGLDVNYHSDESTTRETEREYYMKVSKSFMAKYKLDKGKAENLRDSLGMIYYLNRVLNDMLNNNKTNNEYPRDKEGIYHLLDDYGAMYADRVLLGGSASMIFSREQNVYQHSIKWDLNVAASCKPFIKSQAAAAVQHPEGGEALSASDFKALVEALTAKDNAANKQAENAKVKVSLGFGGTDEQYTNVSKAKLDVSLRGGNLGSNNKYDGWIPSVDPDKWIVIARDEPNQTISTRFYDILTLVKKDIPVDADASVKDADCSYAQLIKRYLDQYYKDRAPKDNTSDAPFIIADFLMLSTGTSNNNVKGYLSEKGKDEYKGDYPKPFIMKGGPDMKERMYYPVMMNTQDREIRAANNHPGYALDTGNDSYLVKTHDYCHYWYYAIDRADRCPGIVDIKVQEKAPSPDYTRRGDNSDDGIHGCYVTRYVWVKYGTSNSYKKSKARSKDNYVDNTTREGAVLDKITGVGLRCTKHNKIIGATAGSDSPYPFNSVGNERLNKIWDCPLNNGWGRANIQFYDSFWTIVPHELHVEFTKEVLDDVNFHGLVIDPNEDPKSRLSVDKTNLSIPKTWGETY